MNSVNCFHSNRWRHFCTYRAEIFRITMKVFFFRIDSFPLWTKIQPEYFLYKHFLTLLLSVRVRPEITQNKNFKFYDRTITNIKYAQLVKVLLTKKFCIYSINSLNLFCIYSLTFAIKCFCIILIPYLDDFDLWSHIFTSWRSYSIILDNVVNF